MPRRWLRLRLYGAFATLSGFVGQLNAQAFVDVPAVRGMLAFDAQATLGAFTGTTTTVTGQLVGAATLSGVHGWVEAPARSLSSQNGKRDRDTWASLDVERFPTLRFQLDSAASGEVRGDSTAVFLVGHFTLHGQTRPVRLAGWFWRRGTQVRFRGAVPLNVKDYGVGGLTKALGILRMNEHIMVRVDVTFGAGERP